MTGLFAAELLKLRTVRSTWGYIAAVAVLAGLATASTVGADSRGGRLADDFQYRLFLDGTAPALLIGLLLGCIVFTGEFRHGTITPLLLALPRRNAVVVVKIVSGAVAAASLTVIALSVIAGVGWIWLTLVDVPLAAGEAVEAAGRAVAGTLLAGALGAAVGGVVQSQVAALVGILVWILVAEPLVWVLLGLLDVDGVADYLPGATVIGLVDTGGDGLTFGPRAGVALAWIGVVGVLAGLRLHRRDIT